MKKTALALTATAALLIAACGQQDEATQTTAPSTPAPQATAAAPANDAGKRV